MEKTTKNPINQSKGCEVFLRVFGYFPDSWLLIPVFCCCIAATLCACSTTSETFDCQAGKGVGCKSISTVNKMVDQGVLGEGIQEQQPFSPPVLAKTPLLDRPAYTNPDLPLSDEFSVRRIQEEHLRVWIAPFQDAHGNFHEGSIVHTVLKPGFWRVGIRETGTKDPKAGEQIKEDEHDNQNEGRVDEERLF